MKDITNKKTDRKKHVAKTGENAELVKIPHYTCS